MPKEIKEYTFAKVEDETVVDVNEFVVVHEAFNRHISDYLREKIGNVQLNTTIEASEVYRFSELINKIPQPTLIAVVEFESIDKDESRQARCFLHFPQLLACNLVERQLGAAYTTGEMKRLPTELELFILRGIFEELVGFLEQAYARLRPTTLKFLQFEFSPAAINIAQPQDMVLYTVITVDTGDQKTAQIGICAPMKLLNELTKREGQIKSRPTVTFRQSIEEVLVELIVEIGKVQITVDEFLKLEVGDVLKLEQKADDMLVVKVNGIEKFKGRVGRVNHRLAVQIEKVGR